MKRGEILSAAAEIVTKDREQAYGRPENNFALIGRYWSIYTGRETSEHDVGVMLALLKIARIQSGQTKDDNYIDLAGYAACAGEIATRVNPYLPADYADRLEGLTAAQAFEAVQAPGGRVAALERLKRLGYVLTGDTIMRDDNGKS